jgi:hypothetical protein
MNNEIKSKHRKYSIRVFLFVLFLVLAIASTFTNADLDSNPVILENISAYVLDSSVIVYWDTNILADSLIEYGLSQNNISESAYFGVHSFAHATELIDLIPNTIYYYFVNSTSANGNSNQSEIYNFTTSEDNVSPEYDNVSVLYYTATHNITQMDNADVNLSLNDNIYYEINETNIYSGSNLNSSVTYSKNKNYLFSSVWKDNGILSNVTLLHNFTGNLIEEEMFNILGTDIYEYSLSAVPAGIYEWKMSAVDSSGNLNKTENYVLEVNKSSPEMNISFNYLENNLQIASQHSIDIEQRSYVNIIGMLAEGDLTSNLQLTVRDSNSILNQSSGIDNVSLVHYFENTGLYNVTLSYNETQNYTSKIISYTINVTPIEINIFIDKPEYNLGDAVSYVVLAPNSSNLSIEVCGPLPTGAGFVECKTLLNGQQSNYPYMNLQSITNKSGTYKIRAQIQYKGLIKYAEKNYTVVNNMQIIISGDTLLKAGEESNLVAVATGGVGVIAYNWTLSNGTKISGANLNVKYITQNTYPVIITATDSQGNLKTDTLTLTVRKHYTIKVLVLDNSDNNAIDSAKVRMTSSGGETDNENTDIDGIAEFDLIEGDYDMRVSSSGYTSFYETIRSDSNKTITVKLSINTADQSNEPLEISLISPINNTFMSSSSPYFEAYVDLGGNTGANCLFYVSEANSDWYRAMKTVAISASGKINHSESFSDGKMYSWKVQCDTNSRTYSSNVLQFKAVGTDDSNVETSITILEDGYNQVIDAGEIRRRIDTAMTNLEALDMESKKDADALQFSASVDLALRDYERAMRDINNIQYRRDLSASEQEAKKIEYYDIIKSLEEKTPIDMKNLGYQTFISYPSKEDLVNISKQYQNDENIIGKINELELSGRQNGIIVTTRISTVEITFINGKKKTVTLIDKSIKLSDNSTNTFIIESIPKEFAQSSDELTVLSEFKVINKDPVLKFEKQENITYYVEGERNLDIGRKINTVLLSDSFFSARNSITGDVTFSSIELTSPTSLIIIIVIISCSYLIYAFDLFGLLFAKSKKKRDEKNINKILGLIRDARMFLQEGRISNADLTFKEIKLIYEGSSEEVMVEVYSEAMILLEMIDAAQTELLIHSADKYSWENISNEDKESLLNSRKMLKEAYNLLSDSLKQKYENKINLLITESNEEDNVKLNV